MFLTRNTKNLRNGWSHFAWTNVALDDIFAFPITFHSTYTKGTKKSNNRVQELWREEFIM